MPRMDALERMMPPTAALDMGGPPPEMGVADEGPIALPDVIAALEELIGTLPEEKQSEVSQAIDILRQVAADKPPSEGMSEEKPQEDGMPPAGQEGL